MRDATMTPENDCPPCPTCGGRSMYVLSPEEQRGQFVCEEHGYFTSPPPEVEGERCGFRAFGLHQCVLARGHDEDHRCEPASSTPVSAGRDENDERTPVRLGAYIESCSTAASWLEGWARVEDFGLVNQGLLRDACRQSAGLLRELGRYLAGTLAPADRCLYCKYSDATGDARYCVCPSPVLAEGVPTIPTLPELRKLASIACNAAANSMWAANEDRAEYDPDYAKEAETRERDALKKLDAALVHVHTQALTGGEDTKRLDAILDNATRLIVYADGCRCEVTAGPRGVRGLPKAAVRKIADNILAPRTSRPTIKGGPSNG